jgi:tetratricopeptide (TPR) repeat protein
VEQAPLAKNDTDVAAPVAADPAPAASARGPSLPEKPEVPRRLSWRQLALDARYAEAFSAAEADNFLMLCRREPSRDVLLLGDTAHFAGAIDRAEQAFRSVRARFPDGHEAAVAAFSLGRIAYDERRNFGSAANWFQTYLREEPSGTLAREASGRLIEAYRGAGNLAAARDAATKYLATYPSGPHAALAQSLIHR